MRVIIEFNVDNAAFEDNMPFELAAVGFQFPQKVLRLLAREPGCVCTHPEADDLIKDSNGNTVGTIKVEE